MQAVICPRYGGPEVLELREVPEPRVREHDVLVRVHATTVTTADARVRAMRMPSPLFAVLGRLALGLRGPRRPVLGTELSGVVERVGPRVSAWRAGDEVVAVLGARFGAHAQVVALGPRAAVARKPPELTHEQAVALPFGALTALHYLRGIGRVRAGQRVLVVGASGAVGAAAVQIAGVLGASADGVCSAPNAQLVRSLGARRVYDYRTEDFARSDARYDVVLDTLGVTDLARCRRVLTPRGRLLAVVLTGRELAQMVWTRLVPGPTVHGGVTPERADDLKLVMELSAAARLRPVIDSCHPLADIAQAHRRVDSGRKVGSVVVQVAGAGAPG